MFVIKENVTNKIEIKKSVFICELIKIDNVDLVKSYLEKAKQEYKDATHYCYAYIIDGLKKSSDDNEPGGTAGIPMLDILDKKNLNNILCIVIRYFGGIKLGAGGLVRAYSKSVKDCLDNTTLLEQIDGYEIELKTDYSKQKELEYLIRDIDYVKKYDEIVTYNIKCTKELLTNLELNNYDFKIIKETKIEK